MKNVLSLLFYIIFLISITSCSKENSTYNLFTINQEILDGIVTRFDNNTLTENDIITVNRIYKDILFFGGILYPEASKILKHYIFGDGGDLEIVSRYFFESDIIINALNTYSDREIIGPITLRISDNPRIAYAINGFYISNSKPIEIYQVINFANRDDRNTYTYFKIIDKELKIPDRLIRVFEINEGCKEFTVRITSKTYDSDTKM